MRKTVEERIVEKRSFLFSAERMKFVTQLKNRKAIF